LDGEGAGGATAEDLFSMFFGGGGSRKSSGPRKSEDVNHPLKVSLEDLYNGKTVKLAINRQVVVGKATKCHACDGQGVVLELRQIALGMVQQLQRRCAKCSGQGYCAETKKERKVLDVQIDQGMRNSQKIVFRGMADEKPNMEPGDINFVIQEKEHDVFKRKGADLLITKTLSLNEALCGFEWMITHLDGRKIVIRSKPGEIIKPITGATSDLPFVKIVPHEGMPSHGNPFIKGNLFILFRVEFPDDNELDPNALKLLKNALPNPSMELDVKEDMEICHLEHADVKAFGKGGANNRATDAYDSDDDEEGGGGGARAVQCQQS
jgi:DnaJ family protein A protein 2